MKKRIASYIIFTLWSLFLFFLWIIFSFSKGTDGEWWSIYRLNPDKYGPWSLEFSYIKIIIAAIISLIIARIITLGFKRK
ncbi:hypothetical protein SB717_26560 [Priestia sp. SIMBA_032]|uniref:hypothetical protein n=1 Tax=Priestia sp. SIMBA_032 TaxID=3085775 RepID=UPI00397916AB